MSRVVFVGLSAYGHINPTLSIVKELVLRGEEVIYIASNKYNSLITNLGSKQIEFKYSRFLFGSHHLKSKVKRTEDEFLESIVKFYDSLKYQILLADRLKRQIQSLNPDYVIHDSTIYYIKYISDELNIPCISSVTMFALNEKMFIESENLLSDFYSVNLKNTPKVVVDRIKEIELEKFEEYGYVHSYLDNSMTKQGLNIVYTSKAFQPYLNSIDNSYHFAGNNLETRRIFELRQKYHFVKKRKVVLISFGSIISGSNELIGFYSKMMNYFRRYNADFILNIGNLPKSVFDSVPNNFILENGINQLQLLEFSDLFITHGGMNGVSEALQLNTPIIVIPKAMDQFMVAEQVKKTGIGRILVDKDIDFSELEYLISEILTNPYYTKNTKRIAESYWDTGEELVAVDKIFEYIGK